MSHKVLSEFHYSTPFIDGNCFQSVDALHDELSFKLGFPNSYGRNWDALCDCLSSIGDSANNLCGHWDLRNGKRMVLSMRGFSVSKCDHNVLLKFLAVVADANNRLESSGVSNRIWIEWVAGPGQADKVNA